MKNLLFYIFTFLPFYLYGQALPTDGPLTLRPLLQQLGNRLLQGKTGSIVAINPANGEILCIATNTPNGFDVRQAIGKPQVLLLRQPRHLLYSLKVLSPRRPL